MRRERKKGGEQKKGKRGRNLGGGKGEGTKTGRVGSEEDGDRWEKALSQVGIHSGSTGRADLLSVILT